MTMKRELGSLTGEVDLDNPRTKRRKELPAPEAAVPTAQPLTTTNVAVRDAIVQDTENGHIDVGVLREQATRLWQTVKDAVNKECVTNQA